MNKKAFAIFFVPGKPVAKGRPRATVVGGHARMYTPERTARYEEVVSREYIAQCGNTVFQAGTPLAVQIIAYMPTPKSTSKVKREKMLRGEIPYTKKPDWDNIGKIICDALNGVAWYDDAQVVRATVSKQYAADDAVGVQVCIQEVRHDEANPLDA